MNEETLPNPFDPAQNSALIDGDVLSGIAAEIEGGPAKEKPNFPVFFPLVFHSINLEIQQSYSFAVRMCYFAACSFVWSMFFNFLCSFFTEQIKDGKTSIFQDCFLSLLFFIFYSCALFYIQYYPLYCAFRDKKSLHNIIITQYFVVIAFLFLFAGFRGTGIMGIGYICASFEYGSRLTSIIGIIFIIWHFINCVLQIVLFFTLQTISDEKDNLLRRDPSM